VSRGIPALTSPSFALSLGVSRGLHITGLDHDASVVVSQAGKRETQNRRQKGALVDANLRPVVTVVFESYFNLRQGFRTKLFRSVAKDGCLGPIAKNHPLVTQPRRRDINFPGHCESEASRRSFPNPAQKQLVLYRWERNYHLAQRLTS
jgi:hypothetical protein